MRHHGWELPYHSLQVTAVAVFLALGFAFYIFFVPFVEYSILEACGLAAYSITVLVVCALYTWCVATDPADVQVTSLKNHGSAANNLADFTSVSLEPQIEPQAHEHSFSFLTIPRLDRCLGHTCMQTSDVEDLPPENRKLFCSLCNVEISMRTKHCRVCDKCIDGFDHHCRWLNNCIGKRNYKSFVILLVAAMFMFTLQWSFGLWILVHRLLRERHYESVIALKLGRSFPSLGYLLVLVSCTVVAMVATYLLGQLIFFHALLIRKGLTTYEYIMAKRNQEFEPEREHRPNSLLMSGPISNCGSYSARLLLQHNVEATSCDHESQGGFLTLKQEKDLGGSWRAFSQRFLMKKTSVKINPLNVSFATTTKEEDAEVASTSMHKLSTGQPVAEMESSFDSSRGFSADLMASFGIQSASRRFPEGHPNQLDEPILCTWQNGKLPLDTFEQLDSSENDSGTLSHSVGTDEILNPLQREARNVFKSSHSFCSGRVYMPPSCQPSGHHVDPSGALAAAPFEDVDFKDLHQQKPL